MSRYQTKRGAPIRFGAFEQTGGILRRLPELTIPVGLLLQPGCVQSLKLFVLLVGQAELLSHFKKQRHFRFPEWGCRQKGRGRRGNGVHVAGCIRLIVEVSRIGLARLRLLPAKEEGGKDKTYSGGRPDRPPDARFPGGQGSFFSLCWFQGCYPIYLLYLVSVSRSVNAGRYACPMRRL